MSETKEELKQYEVVMVLRFPVWTRNIEYAHQSQVFLSVMVASRLVDSAHAIRSIALKEVEREF